MLAIGVEGDDHFRPLRQRVVDPGLQRRALAEVERMLDDDSPGHARRLRGRVARAVVHHDCGMARAPDIRDDAANHRPFVIGRDHDINLGRGDHLPLLALPHCGAMRTSRQGKTGNAAVEIKFLIELRPDIATHKRRTRSAPSPACGGGLGRGRTARNLHGPALCLPAIGGTLRPRERPASFTPACAAQRAWHRTS